MGKLKNVLDMGLKELSKRGYVDKKSIDKDGDFNYSDKGWGNFTKKDHSIVEKAIHFISDLNKK